MIKIVRLYAPGLFLCLMVTAVAKCLEAGESRLFGRAWIESLVLAILTGAVLRLFWTPGKAWQPGIKLCAKTLLEVAVMLLGLSISILMIDDAGWGLFIGIILIVTVTIIASYLIGRFLSLPRRVAILVACGNAICGNSAIAAVAPVIGADGDEIASSIAFTAVLGVIVVLTLPFLIPLLSMTPTQYGVLAGMTVYAVPQVLAATAPVAASALQVGTIVKLVRVLMLGPMILVLSLFKDRLGEQQDQTGKTPMPPLHQLVPWFIVGFIVLMITRSAIDVPEIVTRSVMAITNVLTVLAMAALGIGVDIRMVAKSGPRVTAAACLSLLILGVLGYQMIRFLQVP